MINGISSSGITSAQMVVNEEKKSMLPPRITDKSEGAVRAIAMLHSNEYVATLVILPPSILVITGAAVAVGMKKHINAPAATVALKLAKAAYTATAPKM